MKRQLLATTLAGALCLACNGGLSDAAHSAAGKALAGNVGAFGAPTANVDLLARCARYWLREARFAPAECRRLWGFVPERVDVPRGFASPPSGALAASGFGSAYRRLPWPLPVPAGMFALPAAL